MGIKRKDFQKAAAFIHEFLLKLNEETECAELRDTLNLALLHMQRYYRLLRIRNKTDNGTGLFAKSMRGLSPMTPFKDAPDKFVWKWMNLENSKAFGTMNGDKNKENKPLPSVIYASKEGNNDSIIKIIDEDPESISQVDGLGRTALMYAVHFGHLDTVQTLLHNGMDVNATANDGSTAVHRACHDGQHEALRILIEYNADLMIADHNGRYPIHWACATKNRQCLAMLMEQGISVTLRDKEGMTPSMWACRMDHIDHFELLSQVPNQEEEDGIERDNTGKTWLHWAARRTEPLECLQTLLTEEAALWRDDEGKTVMHTAAEQGSLASVRIIFDIGGIETLNQRDSQNRTPLIVATMGGHGEVVNYFLSQGADLAAVDELGATAWDYARARQLHYCMLIIASYIRGTTKDTDGMYNGVEENMNGINGLQINEQQQQQQQQQHLFGGHSPAPPPRAPEAPHTPRTPRTANTPALQTWANGPAAKQIDSNRGTAQKRSGEDRDRMRSPSSRESSGGKRRKNERLESHMSITSVDGARGTPDDEELHAESHYMDGGDPENETVSIDAMDVSDFEGAGELEYDESHANNHNGDAHYQQKAHAGPPHEAHNHIQAASERSGTFTPSAQEDRYVPGPDDRTPTPPTPTPRTSLSPPLNPGGRQQQPTAERIIPPAHLQPLPTGSATKKKKKKKRRENELAPVAGPVPPPRGLPPPTQGHSQPYPLKSALKKPKSPSPSLERESSFNLDSSMNSGKKMVTLTTDNDSQSASQYIKSTKKLHNHQKNVHNRSDVEYEDADDEYESAPEQRAHDQRKGLSQRGQTSFSNVQNVSKLTRRSDMAGPSMGGRVGSGGGKPPTGRLPPPTKPRSSKTHNYS